MTNRREIDDAQLHRLATIASSIGAERLSAEALAVAECVALVVVGADQPISGEELSLVEEVGRLVPNVVVVINKVDKVADAEQKLAVAFTTRMVTSRLRRPIGPIYAVSATERLASAGPPRDWLALVALLRRLSEREGQGIVQQSARRGLERVANACVAELDMALQALRDPIIDADSRIEALRRQVAAMEFQLPRLNELIRIEQQQIAQLLSSRRDAFLANTLPTAATELQTRIPTVIGITRDRSALRAEAFTMARHVAQEYLDPWFEGEEGFAEQLCRDTAARFVELANTFVAQLAVSADVRDGDKNQMSTSSQLTHRALDPDQHLTMGSRFYFHDMEALVREMAPFPLMLEFVRSRSAVQRTVARRAAWYLAQLLEINSTGVRTDIEDRIVESGRQLEAEVLALFRDVVASAERTIQRAHLARAEGVERVAREISALEAMRREVVHIQGLAFGDL